MEVTVRSLLLVALACAAQVVRGGEHGFESPGVRNLTVGVPLEGEALDLDGRVAVYQLRGLRSLSAYEIKVSYPASVGYEVKVSVERGGVVGGGGRKEPSRVLFNLDCEELRMGVPLRVWHMAVVAVPALVLLIAFMLATALRRGGEGEAIRARKMRSRPRVREVPP